MDENMKTKFKELSIHIKNYGNDNLEVADK